MVACGRKRSIVPYNRLATTSGTMFGHDHDTVARVERTELGDRVPGEARGSITTGCGDRGSRPGTPGYASRAFGLRLLLVLVGDPVDCASGER